MKVRRRYASTRQVGPPPLGAEGLERVERPEVDPRKAAPAVEAAHVGAAEAAEVSREDDGRLRLGARLLRELFAARHARHGTATQNSQYGGNPLLSCITLPISD